MPNGSVWIEEGSHAVTEWSVQLIEGGHPIDGKPTVDDLDCGTNRILARARLRRWRELGYACRLMSRTVYLSRQSMPWDAAGAGGDNQ